MSKPRTSKPSTSLASKEAELEPAGEVDLDRSALTAFQRRTLARIMRFLVSIQSSEYVRRARRVGYTAAEHREGWALWRSAAGEDRPLDHFMTEEQESGASDHFTLLATLQQLDSFENTWFPRTRAIIRRVVPAERRAVFAAAFFRNLEQQPLGPGVVSSVSKYLARIDSLTNAADPAATAVRETLIQRGLTEEATKRMRELLWQLEKAPEAIPEATVVSLAEIEQAQRAQDEAFESLRDWFNDWATTLRSVFGPKERVQLGLATVKRRIAGEEVLEEEDDDAGAGDPKPPMPDVA
jgi:hypothetical protein